jgi:hypothetical protein
MKTGLRLRNTTNLGQAKTTVLNELKVFQPEPAETSMKAGKISPEKTCRKKI